MHMNVRKLRVVTLHYDLKIVVDAQNAKKFWIKRKCKQRVSTNPPISTKLTIATHIISLIMSKHVLPN